MPAEPVAEPEVPPALTRRQTLALGLAVAAMPLDASEAAALGEQWSDGSYWSDGTGWVDGPAAPVSRRDGVELGSAHRAAPRAARPSA